MEEFSVHILFPLQVNWQIKATEKSADCGLNKKCTATQKMRRKVFFLIDYVSKLTNKTISQKLDVFL